MSQKKTFSYEQFALKWKNYSSNLSFGFLSYLTNKNLVDVTLVVEGQLIQAHKLILSICSAYFQKIFKDNPCHHPVVILSNIKYIEIDALLKFMYQGEVNIEHEELENFLKIAEVLQIRELTIENTMNHDIIKKDSKSESEEYLDKTLKPKPDVKTSCSESTKCKNSLKRSKNMIFTRSSKKIKKSSFRINDKVLPFLLEAEAVKKNLIDRNETSIKTEHNDDSVYLIQQTNDADRENDSEKLLLIQQSNSIEPVVTYRLSTRGRPQLVYKGYVYNLTSRSEILNRSHYRCAEQHRGCRGKCAVIEEQFMPTGVYEHNHAPVYQSEKNYKKKRLERNNMYLM